MRQELVTVDASYTLPNQSVILLAAQTLLPLLEECYGLAWHTPLPSHLPETPLILGYHHGPALRLTGGSGNVDPYIGGISWWETLEGISLGEGVVLSIQVEDIAWAYTELRLHVEAKAADARRIHEAIKAMLSELRY